MAVASGTLYKVSVNTGTPAVPVWTVVGVQTDATYTRTGINADTANKDDGGNPSRIMVGSDWQLQFDALLVEDDVGFVALETAYNAKDVVQVQIDRGTTTETGDGVIADITESGPNREAATVSVTIDAAGSMTRA
ncbi:MAG: phage tail tube protein [Desulfuromonadales bacterium]|nr:phage tail tube protein [Desulfuromonadales bacterium]